jgi:hypothetical protein
MNPNPPAQKNTGYGLQGYLGKERAEFLTFGVFLSNNPILNFRNVSYSMRL